MCPISSSCPLTSTSRPPRRQPCPLLEAVHLEQVRCHPLHPNGCPRRPQRQHLRDRSLRRRGDRPPPSLGWTQTPSVTPIAQVAVRGETPGRPFLHHAPLLHLLHLLPRLRRHACRTASASPHPRCLHLITATGMWHRERLRPLEAT